jgi:CheY-like chemotaxis protein
VDEGESADAPAAGASWAATVAEIRRERRLTQEELAREIGVAFSTVNAWEAGRAAPQPRHRRRLEDMLAGSVPAGRGAGAHVLCVDDSLIDLEVLSAMLEDAAEILDAAVTVHASPDPVRALVMLGQLRPVVAFVDVQMPGLDGFHLARQVQEMGLATSVQVVLVTADASPEVRARAEQEGLTVLQKPVSLRDVGVLLRTAVAP